MVEERLKDVFGVLNNLNVNEHTETKKDTGLTYLSWCWAWAEVKKRYPTANYEIEKFNGIPYVHDPLTGYMVYTKVTIEGVTHEMWLPVMDANNRAMKDEPYEVTTSKRTITVAPATMFDVNKAIMRCLVKNLAMFGLGLYVYAGEDLPESEVVEAKEQAARKQQELDDKMAKAIEEAEQAQTKEELGVIWREKYRDLQKYPKFKDAVLNKNHFFAAADEQSPEQAAEEAAEP